MDRESSLVELVDAAGHAIGSTTVAEAHQFPGRRHRAFSVMLRDRAGRVLLQQRAEVKTRFALRWSNTCCGHPEPGEDVPSAAAVRLRDELGLSALMLDEIGVYPYRATDQATGRVEDEYDHVLIGTWDGVAPQPDPAEVADFRWVPMNHLRMDLDRHKDSYTPWLAGVLSIVIGSMPLNLTH
ncbi:isopentenyl-diphosphate Delta-isomerase [Flindersiella endophytica]